MLELLSVMMLSEVEMNIITNNAAISACEKGGEWEKALGLLRVMVQSTAIMITSTVRHEL